MPLLNRSILRQVPIGPQQFSHGTVTKSAGAVLSEGARIPMDAEFDIFLSHSYADAERVDADDLLRAKTLLEQFSLKVYVDWDTDSQLDRKNVTPATAQVLRVRMNQSKSLLYATSENASRSKWMPWELGYFDGKKGLVAVLPIDTSSTPTENYRGQEYLGLYPFLTYSNDTSSKPQFWVEESNGNYCNLAAWLRGQKPYKHN